MNSVKAWLRAVEMNSMPHFARGTFIAMLGYWFGGPCWALGLTLAASIGWEIRDYYKADGFDVMDVVCEMWGAASIVLWTLHFMA